MLLDIFREWLEEENCRVVAAGEGAAAPRPLRDNHVDVLITDVRMPVMDGIVLVKNIRMSCGNPKLSKKPKLHWRSTEQIVFPTRESEYTGEK